jgi:cob(I)alamin adenosyltransferase
MKIYTRTGDDGSTGLLGGSRVAKSDLRLDCYGTLDELNAHLGHCAAAADVTWKLKLIPIQEMCFNFGSHLAAPAGDATATTYLPTLPADALGKLEEQIDQAEAKLPPLKVFILPGGTELASRLHLARTVCRRAERLIVAFAASEPVDEQIIKYLNRLSDWLFVHARLANKLAGIPDDPWQGAKQSLRTAADAT